MKRLFLIALVILSMSLLAIRFIGEQKFPVHPEPISNISLNTKTPIYKSVQALLNQSSPSAESLFYPLGDPDLALISRLRLAKRATDSIDIQYYLFHDDDAGHALLQAIMAAAKRGVKVRLLLDDIDMRGREGLLTQLAKNHETLEIRVFNPTWLRTLQSLEFLARFPRVTRRMHNKSLTVDNISSVVGGRNIGNEYFNVKTDVAFTDFDVLASGAIAGDVSSEFDSYWHSGLAYDVAHLGLVSSEGEYTTWLAKLEKGLGTYRDLMKEQKNQVIDKMMSMKLTPYYDRGAVIYDKASKVISPLFETDENLGQTILELMTSAEKTLFIASPYFIPGESGMKVFRDLRKRDVQVVILTNSLAANDVAAVHSGYMEYRKELLDIGVNLYELKASNDKQSLSILGSKSASLHAKSFVIDGRKIFVGSFNLDPRSAIHNTEMGIVFNNEGFAANMKEKMTPYIQEQSYKLVLTTDDEIEWHENDAQSIQVHHKEPNTSLYQRISVYLISWLPVEWLL